MPRSLALLRAVNVGGSGPLSMAELRAHLAGRGFGTVETLLASGNVLLTSPLAGAELEVRLEGELAGRFGLATAVLTRDAAGWARLVDENPMPGPAAHAPASYVCMVLKTPPPPAGWARLQAEAPGDEAMRLLGRRLYIHYGAGMGRSKLTAAFIERRLSTPGTARNWNTVLKLHARLAS